MKYAKFTCNTQFDSWNKKISHAYIKMVLQLNDSPAPSPGSLNNATGDCWRGMASQGGTVHFKERTMSYVKQNVKEGLKTNLKSPSLAIIHIYMLADQRHISARSLIKQGGKPSCPHSFPPPPRPQETTFSMVASKH